MTRLARRIALQAEIEASYGAGLTGGQTWATALQILPRGRPRHRIERMNAPRDLYLPHLGASDEIPGPRKGVFEFEVEMGASGAAGTAPPWGKLLRACQFAETVTAGSRVEYTPVSEPGESLVLRYWEDGHAYVSRGCRGQVEFVVNAFQIPVLRFRFEGYDSAGAEQSAAQPSAPYAAWRPPLLPTSGNSGNIRLGCTYAAGDINGGTTYPSKGFTLDMGHTLTYDATLGAEHVVVTDRQPKGRMTMQLAAAQEAAWRTEMNASVETTWGWVVGNGSGSTIVFFGRRLQRQAMQGIDDNGFRRVEVDFGLILDKDDPNDDFMRVVVR
jgi:hypothetical protein